MPRIIRPLKARAVRKQINNAKTDCRPLQISHDYPDEYDFDNMLLMASRDQSQTTLRANSIIPSQDEISVNNNRSISLAEASPEMNNTRTKRRPGKHIYIIPENIKQRAVAGTLLAIESLGLLLDNSSDGGFSLTGSRALSLNTKKSYHKMYRGTKEMFYLKKD